MQSISVLETVKEFTDLGIEEPFYFVAENRTRLLKNCKLKTKDYIECAG